MIKPRLAAIDIGTNSFHLIIVKWVIPIFLIISQNTFSQAIDSTLHKAYKMNSQVVLDEFFMNWEKSNELTEQQKLELEEKIQKDDTLREVYNIVNIFYSNFTYNIQFFIFYDTLEYDICKSDELVNCGHNPTTQKITSFRLDNTETSILYLNAQYQNSIIDFFRAPSQEINVKKEDYLSKEKFLDGKLKIPARGNFNGYEIRNKYYIVSDPYIENIYISRNLKIAVVNIMEGCRLTEAEWRKINGIWQFFKVLSVSIC